MADCPQATPGVVGVLERLDESFQVVAFGPASSRNGAVLSSTHPRRGYFAYRVAEAADGKVDKG